MRENRRTKDWLTPEILERATEQQRLVSRPAAETSDHIGKPLEDVKSLVSICMPDRDELNSLKQLLHPRFVKLFASGIILSGALSFFTMNFGNIMCPHAASWATLTTTARHHLELGNLEAAERALNASLNCSYLDSAQKSFSYAQLAQVAERRGNFSDGENLRNLSAQHKASQWGLLIVLISMLFLAFTAGILNAAQKSSQTQTVNPIFVGLCAFGISFGIHLMFAEVPIAMLILVSAAVALIFFGGRAIGLTRLTGFFVTPSRN